MTARQQRAKARRYCQWETSCFGLSVGQVLDPVRRDWVPVCAEHYDAAVDNEWTAQPGLDDLDDD